MTFPGIRERLLLWKRTHVSRPEEQLYPWNATSESEFSQDSGLSRNTGDPLQN